MHKERLFGATLLSVLVGIVAAPAWAGPLKDYVYTPDPNYSYSLVNTVKGSGFTGYVLDMTAQSWKEGECSPALWKHWVIIVRPDNIANDAALLVVSGGNNKHDKAPDSVPGVLGMIAQQTKAVLVEVKGIPNEPVQFSDESRTRTEDEIIAYSFDKYLQTGDPTWPLMNPMVKSAVRAMDSAEKFLKEEADKPAVIKRWVVTGASKRGWTSWLTGAVDDRVIAVAPIVIDMLNLDEQMKRQIEYYGSYSLAIQDYTDFQIQDKMDTPEGQALLEIVDPFEYREELAGKPKFVILGSGDQYWTVDAANLYYPELDGEKYIRYEANADHGIDSSQASIIALASFFVNVISDNPMPKFSWEIDEDGSYRVETVDPPKEVRLWKANAPTKDWRLETIGAAWSSETLAEASPGLYQGQVPPPAQGHDAFYIELVYPGPLNTDFSLTTTMGVPGAGAPGGSKTMVALLITAVPVLLVGYLVVRMVKS